MWPRDAGGNRVKVETRAITVIKVLFLASPFSPFPHPSRLLSSPASTSRVAGPTEPSVYLDHSEAAEAGPPKGWASSYCVYAHRASPAVAAPPCSRAAAQERFESIVLSLS